MPTIDPLGLARCAICGNAFAFEAHLEATLSWQASGGDGFVCKSCAPQVLEPEAAAPSAD